MRNDLSWRRIEKEIFCYKKNNEFCIVYGMFFSFNTAVYAVAKVNPVIQEIRNENDSQMKEADKEIRLYKPSFLENRL